MSNGELIVSTSGLYVAEVLPQPTDWMIGEINRDAIDSRGLLNERALAVMDSIEPVGEGLAKGSTCTDGRFRLGLEDGRPWPGVASQAVGGTLISAFAAAETLDGRFYSPEVSEADTATRLRYTADCLIEAGFVLSRHVSCAGVDAFEGVLSNGDSFAHAEPHATSYIERLKRLVPESVAEQSDDRHIKRIAAAAGKRVRHGAYSELSKLVEAVVAETSEQPIVEKVWDDGRGVHGHRERLIANLAWDLDDGVAINTNGLATRAHGLQVFGVSGSLLGHIANTFSNGGQKESNVVDAWLSMKHFTGSAHGSLGFGLSTLLISKNVN